VLGQYGVWSWLYPGDAGDPAAVRAAAGGAGGAAGQGLTLVHFSAQLKPSWSLKRFVSSLRRVMTHLSTEGAQ
jgi:hypothetical protein